MERSGSKKDRKKALYFFQYLAPWKIDVFREMSGMYDLTIVLFDIDRDGFTYDREKLLDRLGDVNVEILRSGFNLSGHQFRCGIGKLLKKYAPDVVFVHEYSQVTVSLLCKRRRHGYRLYITSSDNLYMAAHIRGFVGKVRKYVLRRCDGAVFYSKDVESYYKERFPSLKTAVCPNIQDPRSILSYRKDFPEAVSRYVEEFGLEGKRIIAYTGRLVGVKGLDLLLEAFSRVPHEDYRLLLVGEGELREELEARARVLGIGQDVVFAGFRFGADLYAVYEMADFLVLPSRFEPFGAVVNEALVLGCPLLASRYIGALDYLDGSNGIIFDPLSEDDFVSSLTHAMERFRSGGTARDSLMLKSFEEYVKVYEDIDE